MFLIFHFYSVLKYFLILSTHHFVGIPLGPFPVGYHSIVDFMSALRVAKPLEFRPLM